MRHKLGSAVAAVALLLASLGYVGRPSPAAAAPAPATGVYSGPAVPGGVTDHNSFAAWLNSPVPYATEFLSSSGSWDEVANPYWALDSWSPWVKAQPGRRLVLSVPLLVSSASGQLAQGASGSFDASFRTLAQNMVNRQLGSSVIRLGWEMNNSSFPWWAGSDPASFRAFYARVVNLMRSVPGAAFSFDWNPNLGVQGGSPLTSFDSFYPGDAYVDVIGLDVYDIKWGDSTSSPASRWSWMVSQPLGLDQHRGYAAAHGKPVSFPEWGLYKAGDQMGGGGDSPFFVDAMADWMASGNTTYQAYFDADWGGGKLATFPNGQAQYKVRFTSASPSPAAPPLSTPTLSNVSVSSITKSSAVVSWTTSLPASSEVSFGSPAPTSTALGAGSTTVHTVELQGLAPRTRYAYTVKSRTSDGSAAESPTAFFTTAKR